MDWAVLSRQNTLYTYRVIHGFSATALSPVPFNLRRALRHCRFRKFGEHPAIPGIPAHLAQLIGSQHFPPLKYQH